jgi:hypothetical protein
MYPYNHMHMFIVFQYERRGAVAVAVAELAKDISKNLMVSRFVHSYGTEF